MVLGPLSICGDCWLASMRNARAALRAIASVGNTLGQFRLLPCGVCYCHRVQSLSSGKPIHLGRSAAFRVARFLADTVFACSYFSNPGGNGWLFPVYRRNRTMGTDQKTDNGAAASKAREDLSCPFAGTMCLISAFAMVCLRLT